MYVVDHVAPDDEQAPPRHLPEGVGLHRIHAQQIGVLPRRRPQEQSAPPPSHVVHPMVVP